jgi:hypothetical protein
MKNYSKKNTAIKLDEKLFKEKYSIKIRWKINKSKSIRSICIVARDPVIKRGGLGSY